jgi:SAM-dependent methyltransferase
MFRYPTLSPGEYLALYEKASSEVWEVGESQRQDFATIYAYLKSHPGGSMLDIGCYAGGFLAGILENFKKFGVEPSISASSSAASKGINILGKTIADLDSGHVFDVVVSIDVIEHVLDAETFLVDALAHVNDNGLLIISTGNPDNLFWKRMFKAKFWYCSFPEHLVFPSYKYFCEFSRSYGLKRPEQIRFGYLKMKLIGRMSRLLRYVAFSFFPALYQALRKTRGIITGSATTIYSGEPVSPIGIFTDHHVIVFKK